MSKVKIELGTPAMAAQITDVVDANAKVLLIKVFHNTDTDFQDVLAWMIQGCGTSVPDILAMMGAFAGALAMLREERA